MMNGQEKSDSSIVAVNSANKPAQAGAESMEPRGEAEGNTQQLRTRRTQCRENVSQRLERVRQAARHKIGGLGVKYLYSLPSVSIGQREYESMGNVFICIENAGSTFNDGKGKHTKKSTDTKKPSRTDKVKSQKKYDSRKKWVKGTDFEIGKDESEGSFRYEVQAVAAKHHYTVIIAGSLPGFMKRIAWECGNNKNLSCDTLVLYGHGHAGIMTTGLGQIPLDPADEVGIQTLNAQKRSINVNNSHMWSAQFDNNRAHFPDKAGTFHVFLLGCFTANQSKSKEQLPRTVAETLNKTLGCKVVAYGTNVGMDNAAVEVVLNNLREIKGKASKGAKGEIELYTLVGEDDAFRNEEYTNAKDELEDAALSWFSYPVS